MSPRFNSFKRYGAIGITICPEWENFSRFYQDMQAMPENCNALGLVNEARIFSKSTCEWVKNTAGKKPSSGNRSKKKSVSIVLDINQYEAIQKAAIQDSKKDGKTKTMSMVISEALRKSFPFLMQKDLFGDKV